MNNRIYLDHAATTRVAPEVLSEMLPCFTEIWGNPSSVHGTGRAARKALDLARRRAAAAIGAKPQEIFFTSGGSESDNWALKSPALAKKRGTIITTSVEHPAVLQTCRWLERQGFRVVYLPVDRDGRVNPEDVRKAITEDTILVSVMTANNEVGTIQPIAEISKITRERNILFHTDAVQAMGSLDVNVDRMGVDMMSISGHKIYGPKGTGILYIRQGVHPAALIHGGAQERGFRAGTENVPGIVGLGKAMELAVARREADESRVRALRDRLIREVMDNIPHVHLDGHPQMRLANHCHFTVDGVEGEALLLRLDLENIACSSGSACTAGSLEPSHVLGAMGRTAEQAKSGLRITLGRENTEAEIDETVQKMKTIIADLRTMTGWHAGASR